MPKRQDWSPHGVIYRVAMVVGDDVYYLDELQMGPPVRPKWGRLEAGALEFGDKGEAGFLAELIMAESGMRNVGIERGPSYRRR